VYILDLRFPSLIKGIVLEYRCPKVVLCFHIVDSCIFNLIYIYIYIYTILVFKSIPCHFHCHHFPWNIFAFCVLQYLRFCSQCLRLSDVVCTTHYSS
jgi:hypothetical protein